MDKISVIIPVYKAEKYLNRCLESIVNQTYKNLEIIVMDDDSPDNCPQMCDSWALSDERIKVFHIENKGAANARNKALEIASGKYIAFADSDDYTEPEFIERLYKISLKNNSDISVCGYFDNEGTNKEKYEDFNVDKKEAMKKIALGDYVFGVLWNKLYRADVIKNIKMPDFVCCEDLVFNYYAFKKSDSISQTNEKLYHYMHDSY
ncbi:MAG: glycosyltransferase, partial [Clostridiales bacterium]|nr:glycosyltransferase [Clostridiales bacterium]